MASLTKSAYFMEGIRAGCHRHKAWVLEAFAVTDLSEPHREVDYPYPLYATASGLFTLDPTGARLDIEGSSPTEPLLRFSDPIVLKAHEIANLATPITTTIGNVLVNQCVLVEAMGDKVPFQTGLMKVSGLEKLIAPRLSDDPGLKEKPSEHAIYIDEFKRFNEGIRYLEGFTQLCVPSATPKALTVSKELLKRRDELYKQYKDSLDDPVVQAKISDELVKMDRDWFKGDPAERFYIKDKSFDIVRKKMYIMQGESAAFGKKGDFIGSSLDEGWKVKDLPTLANSQRYGSYSRGFLTALGGVEAKGNYRIFQNTVVAEEDCHSKLGLRLTLTDDTINFFVSHSVVNADGSSTEITPENKKSFVGKPLIIRSPAYCKTPGHNVCAVCVGKLIAETPNALSTYASDLGSVFLSLLLAAAHGSALKTAKIDYLGTLA